MRARRSSSEEPKPCADSVSSSCVSIFSAGFSEEAGILRDVRDELAAQLLTLEHREHEDVAALDPDLASRDARATARVAENGQADSGLAGA